MTPTIQKWQIFSVYACYIFLDFFPHTRTRIDELSTDTFKKKIITRSILLTKKFKKLSTVLVIHYRLHYSRSTEDKMFSIFSTRHVSFVSVVVVCIVNTGIMYGVMTIIRIQGIYKFYFIVCKCFNFNEKCFPRHKSGLNSNII